MLKLRSVVALVPVSDPQRWAAVAQDLGEILTFLTGDLWLLEFYKSPEPLFHPQQKKLPKLDAIQAVSLFSGGVDSLAGVIDLLAGEQSHRLLLIGHYDSSGPRKAQSNLATALDEKYPNRLDIEHV